MEYFEEQEKKLKDALEEKKYQELYAKQVRVSKIILLACFIPMGVIFVIVGIVLALILNEEEAFNGIIFVILGAFFLFLGLLFCIAIPKKGNYERYKKNMQRFGGMSTYSMAIQIGLLEERVKQLEIESEELKRKLKNK